MARKRKKLNKLAYNSQEYWNRLLSQDGLSLDMGLSNKLLYVGSGSDLERLAGFISTDSGRVSPHQTDGDPDFKE